ncbi:MAG TPA: hypothetical protein VIG24_03795 [Acidimicrobiia bacterium]
MGAGTRPMHWMPPKTVVCPDCDGSGRWSGMFHSSPCAPCRGAGIVKADGEALPDSEVVPVLRQRLTELEDKLRRVVSHPEIREVIQRHRERREAEKRASMGSRFD